MSRGRIAALAPTLFLAVSACVSDSPTIEDTVVEAGPSDAVMVREETWIIGPETAECAGDAEQTADASRERHELLEVIDQQPA